LDPQLDVLLVVTGSLQLGAPATRAARCNRAALAMSGTNAALALAFCVVIFAEFLRNHERTELWPAVVFALQVAATVATAIGVAKRIGSGWLFWPVWLWNFALIYALVYLRFFFRIYF
jgi:tellurite resistance protein TehA-like permease